MATRSFRMGIVVLMLLGGALVQPAMAHAQEAPPDQAALARSIALAITVPATAQQAPPDQAGLVRNANGEMGPFAQGFLFALNDKNEVTAKETLLATEKAAAAPGGLLSVLFTLSQTATDGVVRSHSKAALDHALQAENAGITAASLTGDSFRGKVREALGEAVSAIFEFLPALLRVDP